MLNLSSWRSFGVAIALAVSMTGSLSAATIIADLRDDYDAAVGGLVNGQGTAGLITDSIGTGSWNYLATDIPNSSDRYAMLYNNSGPGNPLFESTVVSSGSVNPLGKLSNTNFGTGTLGSDYLSMTTGATYAGSSLVMQWTAGSDFLGALTLTAGLMSHGTSLDRSTLSIYMVEAGMRTLLGTTSPTAANTLQTMVRTVTLSAGDSIEVIVGKTSSSFHHPTSVSFQITGSVVPEPGTMTLAGMAVLGAVGHQYRRRRHWRNTMAT